MSQFECSVKDLTQTKNSESYEEIKTIEKKEQEVKRDKDKDILSKNNQMFNSEVKESFFNKIKEEKNVRVILLVIISYLITNSKQFTELLENSFPYLIESGSTNLAGKLVIATMIGLTIVIFTSFFQVP